MSDKTRKVCSIDYECDKGNIDAKMIILKSRHYRIYWFLVIDFIVVIDIDCQVDLNF